METGNIGRRICEITLCMHYYSAFQTFRQSAFRERNENTE